MSPKIVNLYLVRHGETIGNDVRLLLHPNEDVLNETGKQQAGLLGDKLSGIRFTHVITSTYPRTKETASIVLSKNSATSNPSTKTDERLREIDTPNSYGKNYSHVFGALVQFLNTGAPTDEFDVDGSEPIPQTRKRAKEFLLELVDELSSSADAEVTALVVAHGALNRCLLECFQDASLFEVRGWDDNLLRIMRNTSVHQIALEIPGSGGKIGVNFKKIHDVGHFPKEMLEGDSLVRMAATKEGKCISGCFMV